MKLFRCQHCAQVLYFENTRCERCGHRLGYLPEKTELSALEPADGTWRALATPDGPPRRFCANAEHEACNWLLPPDAAPGDAFCLACRHNRTVPDLGDPAKLLLWRQMQAAQHRLFYALLRLRLPLATRAEDPEHGLAFDILADPPPESDGPKVMTGHDNGLITIALVEADDAERERRRTGMGEPYRTLLGHFRHEVGHHYETGALAGAVGFDPYRAGDVDAARLVGTWLPLPFALNGLNRCMGQADLYPFILSQPVIEKLGFVHEVVQGGMPVGGDA